MQRDVCGSAGNTIILQADYMRVEYITKQKINNWCIAGWLSKVRVVRTVSELGLAELQTSARFYVLLLLLQGAMCTMPSADVGFICV